MVKANVSNHVVNKAAERAAGKSKKENARSGLVELGKIFRKKRLELGLSVKTVASYLDGVSPETLEEYESGKLALPLNRIYALSNCLNVSARTITNLLTKLD